MGWIRPISSSAVVGRRIRSDGHSAFPPDQKPSAPFGTLASSRCPFPLTGPAVPPPVALSPARRQVHPPVQGRRPWSEPFLPLPLLCFVSLSSFPAPHRSKHRAVATHGGGGKWSAPPQAHSPACAFALARALRRRAAVLRCSSPRAGDAAACTAAARSFPHGGGGAPAVRYLGVFYPARLRPAVVAAVR